MIRDIEELYDYDVLRRQEEATMFVVRLEAPTFVLGGSQPSSVIRDEVLEHALVRRRRGGGGIVLLQPGDVWIDWWIPANDDRWSKDVHESSNMAGSWWLSALKNSGVANATLHIGSLEGEVAHRLACFAGRGPGEIFSDGKKVVGVTQWRVREGIFLSSVLHAFPSLPLVDALVDAPSSLEPALDHHTLDSLAITDSEALVGHIRQNSGSWRFRQLFLTI